MSGIDNARQICEWGYNLLPAGYRKKAPMIDWRRFQTERTDHKIQAWFSGSSPKNYWVLTGAISRVVVLDMDSPEAERWWREVVGIGDLMDQTTCAKTSKGHHYHFRLAEGVSEPTWSVHKDENAGGVSFDVRGDGSGVIVPPSVHESGMIYTWLEGRDPGAMVALPPGTLTKAREQAAETLGVGGGGDGSGAGGGVVRSMLTALLEKPGDGGYNIWFTKVCGHYAKQYRDQRDAYEYHCWEAYEKLRFPGSEPHPKKDASKTLESVWRKEHAKVLGVPGADGVEGGAEPEADNGWLVSGGSRLLVQCRIKTTHGDKDVYTLTLEEWADFDIRALGVVEDAEAERAYDVELVRKRHGDLIRAVLPAKVAADSRQLSGWLAEYGVFISPPDSIHPKNPGITVRLGKYLESQNPAHFRVVDHLGWHVDRDGVGGFVTHEGVITAIEVKPHRDVMPHPQLRNWAPYRYGFAKDEAEAVAVLREILTFHDETVTSVFGAWWAACLLKPQIHKVASQFPFMALEATSESGKTTGFFSMMLALAGNTNGNVNPTKAALRDFMSAHSSGIVWIDDLDDAEGLMELLRQATGEGSVAKKGEDRTTTKNSRLVSPILLSGEHLNLNSQKALVDRAIQVSVPSPTSRRSTRDPQVLQWVDVVALKRKYPDLSALSGTLVQAVLRHADLIEMLPSLVGKQGGRYGDKIGVLRLGAALLAAVTGDTSHIQRVDDWCEAQVDVGAENTLTLSVLPAALSQTGWRSRPQGADGAWPVTPCLVVTPEKPVGTSAGAKGKKVTAGPGEPTVWFSPRLLGMWWSAYRHGRIETRTESADALEQQARALGLGGALGEGRKRFYVDGDSNKKVIYWSLPTDLGRLVLARSKGETVDTMGGVYGSSEALRAAESAAQQLALYAYTRMEDAQEPGE